ncbi:hypothetical protein F5884DRAFT_87204 [Xylogone sp. PMI_703]|nr:hypothetical protein F5884DRAFT_87204 [Xylogone sp. PMI_703]
MSPRRSRISSAALAAVAAMGVGATTSDPCAQISDLVANGTSTFSSELGLACLESFPFQSDLAVSFIDEYTKYSQWQSTIELLRTPPPEYLGVPTDILGGLSTIRNKAAQNLYQSHYDFDTDLFNLVSSANDGHYAIQPCSLITILFSMAKPLVSVSSDGVSLPQIYTLDDGLLLALGVKDVSPVVLINGVGAEAYIEQFSSIQGFQDPDARYNAMFANVPIDGQGNENDGSFTTFVTFPGVHSFRLTHANGTEEHIPLNAIFAGAAGSPTTFSSGKELWTQACLPSGNSTDSKRSLKSRDQSMRSLRSRDQSKRSLRSRDDSDIAPPLDAPPTYPDPVVRDPYNLLVGYFPDGVGIDDVAVLSVPTFSTSGPTTGGNLPDDSIANFAIEAQKFVNNATASGKKKIIIDVTGNPGGTIDSGFAMLSIFFPNMTIFSATRWRSTPALNFVVETFNAPQIPAPSPDDNEAIFFLPFQVQPDQKAGFKKLSDLEGPFYVSGIPSSGLVAGDNFSQVDSVNDPININGLGGKLDGKKPPYAPEDIVILTDGQCSSTCTIFINHMLPRGVRVVSIGGRPQLGPMQAVGGVKGSQVLELSDISDYYDLANELIDEAAKAGKPIFTDDQMAAFAKEVPVALDQLPFLLTTGSVNFRNAFSPTNDQVPTQFIYQSAYCRIFYTAESLVKPELRWALVGNAIWGGGDCAFRKPEVGSSSGSSSKSSSGSDSSDSTDTTTGDKSDTEDLVSIVSSSSGPSSSSGSGSGSGTSNGPAHKALGLLLALSQGMKN